MKVSPFAGKPAEPPMLVNAPKLITAYYTVVPDPSVQEQRVSFGTSGHRGSALEKAFNERHILAISQAICLYRRQQKIDGPLFFGMDTHALAESFLGEDHLRRILEEAQTIVNDALPASPKHPGIPAKTNSKEKP